MRIRRASEEPKSLIDIAPLIDIMFTLIIFFLATTTFEKEERDIKVSLPDSSKSNTLSSAPKVVVINVREDGSYYLGQETMPLPVLQERLIEAVKAKSGQKVLIRGDQRALHGHVAAAVLACKKAGINEANIGYKLPR